jgi:hypothetical protein
MQPCSRAVPAARAACHLLLALAVGPISACATLRATSSEVAVQRARRSVCGPPGSPTDAGCTVRGVERVGRAQRVLIDRQPPAGNDRLAVLVRGDQVKVSHRDSVVRGTP